MKHLYKSFACAILVCFVCSPPAVASNFGIALSKINYTFDTVGFGYTITVNAQLTNYDSVPFSGPMDFGLRTDHYNLTTSSLYGKPPYSGNQISLYPYEVVPAIFSIHIEPQYFSPGPDVVVVWPIANSPYIDSILINIIVQNPSGIKDDKEDLFSYIIAGNKIFLKNTNPETNIKQVRIYNLLCQLVSEMHSDFINFY